MGGSAFRLGSIALVTALLAACGGGKSNQASQVVAKVDDSEITVSQLSEALATRGARGSTPEVTRQAVDSLINEQLLVARALDNKLDRDPAVVQALEHTRRQVLARAYVERMVFPRDAISAAEQIEYYQQHPALFEKRKMFQVLVFTLQTADLPAPVRTQLANVHTPDDVSRVLTAHHISYESQSLTRGAEQLPLDELPKFAAAQVGEVIALKASEGRTPLMLITGIQDSPISVDRAQPIIQQYLVNTRNAKALEEHLQHARAAAKIAYFDNVERAATEQIAGQLQNAVASEAGAAAKNAVSMN